MTLNKGLNLCELYFPCLGHWRERVGSGPPFPHQEARDDTTSLQASLSAKGMGCNVPVKSRCSVSDSLTMIALSFPGIPVQFSEQIQWLGDRERLLQGAVHPKAPNTKTNMNAVCPLRLECYPLPVHSNSSNPRMWHVGGWTDHSGP